MTTLTTHPATLNPAWDLLCHLVCARQDCSGGDLGFAALHLNAIQHALDAGEGGNHRRRLIAGVREERQRLAQASFAVPGDYANG